MSDNGVLRKDQLEVSLHNEKMMIESGRLKEENPLDLSENFQKLCEGARRGNSALCQEAIAQGANLNARDPFDYTPLILASLCGHYEVVQLLLEAGALCERDTFQGERCLYNALTDRIRNLLLSYDYSKSSDPLQPLASHITSLLSRQHPVTADIAVVAAGETFHLHKFILSARSPYFQKKLAINPESTSWRLPNNIPPQAFAIAIRYLYLGEIPRDLGSSGSAFSDSDILMGIEKISKHLEIQELLDGVLDMGDRRLARQRRSAELERSRDQLNTWFNNNIIKHRVQTSAIKAKEVKWDRDNGIFADVLLCAEEAPATDESGQQTPREAPVRNTPGPLNMIPVGPSASQAQLDPQTPAPKAVLFPAHRAMLIRSEFFLTMFNSSFKEAQRSEHLQIIHVECAPDVLEHILYFLYTENADFPLEISIDVLLTADLLMIERLKAKAAVVISNVCNGKVTQLPSSFEDQSEGTTLDGPGDEDDDDFDIYTILRCAWATRVQRLEETAARYLAHHLETYIDTPEFSELIDESASRIQQRQETDSIELLDDIRYYLSERFRLRFEDAGIDEMLDDEAAIAAEGRADTNLQPQDSNSTAPEHIQVPESSADKTRSVKADQNGHVVPPTNAKTNATATAKTNATATAKTTATATAKDTTINPLPAQENVVARTLDGNLAGDEFESDALNYQILLGKLDAILDRLHLDG